MITAADRTLLFKSRPFRTRNADEFNLNDVLSLFIDPITGTRSPFDYENTIVKGRMGSGKTMYLRANYAYHLFNIVPRIVEGNELVLPVSIKLNDFQHVKDASEIYRQIIIKISEEICAVYENLKNAEYMARIHMGMKKVPHDSFYHDKSRAAAEQMLSMTAQDYAMKVSTELTASGKVGPSYASLFGEVTKYSEKEIKLKKNPGIKDIETIYNILLKPQEGKLLLLIDEAGTLDKDFFKEEKGDSFFEIMMNQFRTSEFIRTKIAVYPNSYSDILTETRYGDVVVLEENVLNYDDYSRYRSRVESLVNNYVNVDKEDHSVACDDVFNNSPNEDPIEQIINGSNGNYRRLIQLLDLSMDECFIRSKGSEPVKYEDVVKALCRHAGGVEALFGETEKQVLANIVKVCKSRSAFRFKYPNNALTLYKFLSKSQEFNLINVLSAGAGRRSTIYNFDYAYCVLQDIPTHYVKGTERIDKTRSFASGEWVERTTTISNELIAEADKDKVPGKITYFHGDAGFIEDENGARFFCEPGQVIEADRKKELYSGRKVLFLPSKLGDTTLALEIELL